MKHQDAAAGQPVKRSLWQKVRAGLVPWSSSQRKREIEFDYLARQLGYSGGGMDVACRMAHRLTGAEAALKRIEAARAREIEALPLPKLNASEVERIAMLVEELGEVAQALGKVLRDGYEHCYRGGTNRVALEREIGDLRIVTGMMLDAGDLRLKEVQTWQRIKRECGRWTHHQDAGAKQ